MRGEKHSRFLSLRSWGEIGTLVVPPDLDEGHCKLRIAKLVVSSLLNGSR
ncbi:MAG: hypothetical protein JWP89_4764 [Schlesneria sp.]|nr:hypothetical protein [Schlesneria sp.]